MDFQILSVRKGREEYTRRCIVVVGWMWLKIKRSSDVQMRMGAGIPNKEIYVGRFWAGGELVTYEHITLL